jgi:two-component system response regulator HydG
MLQAKLLRVIQHAAFKPVGRTEDVRIDTRFIAATNRDLSLEVKQGKFRQDLFYRLGVVQIWLPPLRERGEDVLLLAEHFRLELAAVNRAVVGFTPEVLECFLGYSWPGNVRELRNVIERALTLTRGDRIALADLPPELQSIVPDTAAVSNEPAIRSRASRLQAVSDAEHAYLVNLLQTCGGNVSRAAQEAGITRQGFYKLLEKHGLSAGSFRP